MGTPCTSTPSSLCPAPRAAPCTTAEGRAGRGAGRCQAGGLQRDVEGWADVVVGLRWYFLPHIAVHERGDANSFFISSWESEGVIQARGCHLPRGITFGKSLSSSVLCFQHPPAHPSSTNPLGQWITPAAEPSREMLALKEGVGSKSTPWSQAAGGGRLLHHVRFVRPSPLHAGNRAVCLCVAPVRAVICRGYI